MLKRAKGNLLDLAEAGEFDCIVHGANCWNTFGSGIAREIRARYPSAAAADAATKKGDCAKLGTWTVGLNDLDDWKFVIVNAYTQYNMSSGQDVFEYTAFELILQKLAFMFPESRFGFPYIGMGLAKGDPARIIPMLEKFAEKITKSGGSVTLVEFQP